MNISQKRVSPDFFSDIPSNPKEQWEWLMWRYKDIAISHINHLKRFKILPDKEQSLSFTGIFRDEKISIQYGALLIEFPYAIKNLKQSDWIRMFDIIVDNRLIEIDTGICSVPEVVEHTSTSASRLVSKLLPPKVHTQKTYTSSACMPKRFIRIQLKKS